MTRDRSPFPQFVSFAAANALTVLYLCLAADAQEFGAPTREAIPIAETAQFPPGANEVSSPQPEPTSDRLEQLEAEWQAFQESQRIAQDNAASLPTLKLGGQVAIDSLWFSQGSASRAAVGDVQDTLDFRRARLYATGQSFEVFNYAIGFDFAQGTATNGRPVFLDNYLGVQDLPYINNLRIGHFFEPFSLERNSSNRNTTFLERSLADAFAPARNVGIMLFNETAGRRLFYALGTFRAGSDNFGDDSGDQIGQVVTGRVAYRPYYDESTEGRALVHLGAGYSFRGAADGTVQFRSRPEAFGQSDSSSTGTPFFVDTGELQADYNQLFGGELVCVLGSFSVQAEYMATWVDRTTAPNVAFHGGYVYASYFLTGEHRPYNRATATMDRVVPIENFFHVRTSDDSIARGRGAWEVALRLSQIDLADKDVFGGVLTDLTAGLNWYPTPYHRLKFNYILAHLQQANTSNTSIFGLRFDCDF